MMKSAKEKVCACVCAVQNICVVLSKFRLYISVYPTNLDLDCVL